jgi:hypothetical protein
MATIAFAAANLGLDKMVLSYLRPTNEQAEFLSNGALNVNRQISQKNGTLEITQVIGDRHQLYIFMRFTAPKGTILDAERYAFD